MSLSARKMPLAVPLALVMAGAALALATDVPALPTLHCPLNATRDQCNQHSYFNNTYQVGGFNFRIEYDGENLLGLGCYNSLQLDSEQTLRSLPQFTPALRVMNVTVTSCLPAHYATVLAALNVTLTSPFNLELSYIMRNEPLTTAHFADLSPLRHLMLDGLPEGVLHGLPATLEGLTTLSVKHMWVLDDILEALPGTLTELRLEEVNITRVPAAVLDLPELRSLHLENRLFSTITVERSNTSRLQQLYVSNADDALMSEWAPPALEEVTLKFWGAERPKPIPACDKLVKLTLLYPHVRDLPAGWVARCPRLEKLHITQYFKDLKLPARLLKNATQLTTLDFIGDKYMWTMFTLPPQLFADTPHLTHFNLNYNSLQELPAELFADTPHLTYLNLNHNQLTQLPPQLFANTPHLTHLDLRYNSLKELPVELFANTPHLTHLDLSYNSLKELPAELFANTPHLTHLDLSYNRLIQLPSSMLTLPLLSLDLGYNKFNTSVVAELASFTELRNLSLAGNREIGDLCAVNANDSNVPGISSLAILLKLEQLNLQGTNVSVICSDWRKDMVNLTVLDLRDTKITNLRTCATVPPGCYCGMAGGGLLRVICIGVNLDHVPLPSLNNDTGVYAVDLVLSNNSITELVVDELSLQLRVLDLRNNSISYMNETTARALVSCTKRRVLLAGNRLECSCRATPALRVLRDHAAVLVGYDALRCEDGRTLQDAIKDGCSKFYTIVITASLASVIAVLMLALWLARD